MPPVISKRTRSEDILPLRLASSKARAPLAATSATSALPVLTHTTTSATRSTTRRQTTLTRSQSSSSGLSSTPGMTTRRSTTALSSSLSAGNLASESDSNHPVANGSDAMPVISRHGGTRVISRTRSIPVVPTTSMTSKDVSPGSIPSCGLSDGGLLDVPACRYGRGKENIPPLNDQEDVDGARRPRLISRSSSSCGSQYSRQRSGSIVSVRSEASTNGRCGSLAPSLSSSSTSSWNTLSSPNPSETFSKSVSDLSIPISSSTLFAATHNSDDGMSSPLESKVRSSRSCVKA